MDKVKISYSLLRAIVRLARVTEELSENTFTLFGRDFGILTSILKSNGFKLDKDILRSVKRNINRCNVPDTKRSVFVLLDPIISDLKFNRDLGKEGLVKQYGEIRERVFNDLHGISGRKTHREESPLTTTADNETVITIPFYAPFKLESLVVKFRTKGSSYVELRRDFDYTIGLRSETLSKELGVPVYGAISFHDVEEDGEVCIEYQSVEEVYVKEDIPAIYERLREYGFDTEEATWEDVYPRKELITKPNTLSHLEYFNNPIDNWDVSKVTELSNMFGDRFEVSDKNKEEVLSFAELKILRERDWYRWKNKFLKEEIKFLEYNWSIHPESLAELRIRLQLSKGADIYRTGIIDSSGKIHHKVRIRELELLYRHLSDIRDQRVKRTELIWELIQKAEKPSELPEIPKV